MGAIGPRPLKVLGWPLLPWTSDPPQCEAITQHTTLLYGTVKPNLPTRTQQAQVNTQYSCGLRLKATSVTQNPDLPYIFSQFGSTLVGLGNSSDYLRCGTALPSTLAWTPHAQDIKWPGQHLWTSWMMWSSLIYKDDSKSLLLQMHRQTQETWKIKERIITLL